MISTDVLIVTHINPYVEVITFNPDAEVLTYSDLIRMWEDA